MTATKMRWCWRKDLSEFRGLSDRERAGFLVLLEWFENFRLRHELPAGREAAKVFWKSEVVREDREREKWQLEQWADAIRWYLNWLSACSETGADHRSLAERLRSAVHSSGARRGLLKRTKQCYGAWAARYARFAGSEQAVMEVATATRFLTAVVEDEDCAISTQRQALNALAHFFKHVLGVEKPVFGVKLRETGTRVPVVLSKPETQRLFEKLREQDQRGMHYELAARLQYGAGLRLSELVRMRVQDVDEGRGIITIREAKGDKQRTTMLPEAVRAEVAERKVKLRGLFGEDRAAGLAGAWLPEALLRKHAHGGEKWPWQYFFPAAKPSIDPQSGLMRRHHVDAETDSRAAWDCGDVSLLFHWPTCRPVGKLRRVGAVR